jgi:hypothetical protein
MIILTVAANPQTTARNATVTVSGAGVAAQNITVTQSVAGTFLSVNPATATLESIAGSADTLSVTSNKAWTALSDQPWLTVSPASGNGNGTIILTALANPVTAARGALVTVSAAGLASQFVMVTQSPAATSLSVSPVTLTVGAAAGSSASVNVVSNAAWTIASDQTWITVTPASGSGNGQVIVTATANTVAVSRIATLTVSAAGAEPHKVTVTQSALVPTLTVHPALLTVGAVEGSSSYFVIESNSGWTVSSNMAWLSVTPSSGTGNGTVVIKASANGMAESRYATVLVSVTGLSGQQVVVMQSAFVAELAVSPPILAVESVAGSTAEFSVSSNTTWNVSSDQGWLVVNPASGTGNGKVVVTAEKNPAASIRSATVLVTAAGKSTQPVSVQQAASPTAIFIPETGDHEIRVYPNPFGDGFWVAGIQPHTVMKLSDLTGRVLLFRETGSNSYITSAGLAPGMYLLRIYMAGGCRECKLVKK